MILVEPFAWPSKLYTAVKSFVPALRAVHL
jgi:hypothetical protein